MNDNFENERNNLFFNNWKKKYGMGRSRTMNERMKNVECAHLYSELLYFEKG